MKVSIIVPAYNVEKHIGHMLSCIKQQTMTDFEAIIINDGSTDNTQRIIDNYCKEDTRFKSFYQSNGGVSAARNLGLSKATGKYIAFWDADDYVHKKSLEWLCDKAETRNADLVIGIMKTDRTTETSVPRSIKKLNDQEYIDKWDHRLVWGFSACNKLFRHQIIKEDCVQFRSLSLGEDGVFWLDYLGYCTTVVSCPKVVYTYNKRFSFEDSTSLTQKKDRYYDNYFTEYISALEEVCEKLFFDDSNYKVCYYRERFFQELYKRLIRNNIVFDMYRSIWILSDSDRKLMYENFRLLKGKVYDIDWNMDSGAYQDLELRNGLQTLEFLSENPKISFVVTRKLSPDEVRKVVSRIYQQKNPEFELFLDDMVSGAVKQEILEMDNCRVITGKDLAEIKNQAVTKAKGEYIMFFDEALYLGENTIKNFLMNSKGTDNITSLYVKHLQQGKTTEYKILKRLYQYNSKKLTKEIDFFFSNKVFKCSYLKEEQIKFTNQPKKDILSLYSLHAIRRTKAAAMASEITQREIWRKVNFKTKLRWKFIMKLMEE